MKEFTETLPWVYFKGIQDGKITVLFFEKMKMDGAAFGDLINFVHLGAKVKMYFDHGEIISFRDVTDEIAQKAGFANRELLSEHLMNRFNIESFDFSIESKIDDELFYMVFIVDDPDDAITTPRCSNRMKKGCFKNWGNLTLNDEYEQQPWRN